MKITRRLTNLAAGTIIERKTGIIILVSGYNNNFKAYNAVDTEITEEGGILPLDDTVHYVTPIDLIGGEIL